MASSGRGGGASGVASGGGNGAGAGSGSGGGIGSGSAHHVSRLVELGNSLRELQLKYETQSQLLRQNDKELRNLKVAHRKLRAEQLGDGGGGGAEGDILATLRAQTAQQKQEVHKLSSLLDKARYDKTTLEEDVAGAKRELAGALAERESVQLRVEVLQESIESVKAVAYQYEDECKELREALRATQTAEAELRESLATKEDILGSLQSEAKIIGKQRSDMNAIKRETNRNRRQVLLLAENSNRLQSDTHNSLLRHKKLLEELKLEYGEHAETVRAEWNLDRKAKMEDYHRLKAQLDELKLIQFEDKQQLLREQREVVKALQTQFEEYRQTAEFLFETEATKMQDKLRMQAEKYEQEITFIVKAKDQHFDQMMTAKDAKIMNLIEGSDLQNILIQHEQETEKLRRSHVDDLEATRLRTEAEQRDVIAGLHRELQDKDMLREKLRDAMGRLEEQLVQARAMGDRRFAQMEEKEQRHADELQRSMGLLQEALAAKEKLNQEKQDLRHRIVRMQFMAKGDADETLPNLVKRLSLETSSLKAKYGKIVGRYEAVIAQHKKLQQQHLIQAQHLERATGLVAARDQELRGMVQRLSKLLFYRVQGKFGEHALMGQGQGQGQGQGRSQIQEGADGASGNVEIASTSAAQRMTLRGAITTLQRVLDKGTATATGGDPEVNAPASESDSSPGQAPKSADDRGADASMPAKLRRMLDAEDGDGDRVDRAEVMELARGINYLRKFQQVSAAYSGGAFRLPLATATRAYGQAGVGLGDDDEDVAESEEHAGTDSAPHQQHMHKRRHKRDLDTLSVQAEVTGKREEYWHGNTLYEKLDAEEAQLMDSARASRLLYKPRQPPKKKKSSSKSNRDRSPESKSSQSNRGGRQQQKQKQDHDSASSNFL